MLLFESCKKNGNINGQPNPPQPPVTPDVTANIAVDVTQKQQAIDGFGFFGAQDVWWGNASNLYSDAWASQVLEDLGITIWRNEYYPPATGSVGQDADWNKQRPVVEGLARVAKNKNIPLKFIFTVWSPPAQFKCAIDNDGNPISGTPNPGGTKNGGTLDPAKYTEFGNWLADGIQLYKDLGIDVYAISMQNEPLFKQSFNSAYYKPQRWYGDALKNVVPVVKARFPNVKFFGSENMLEMEGGKDRQYFYHKNLLDDAAALSKMDIWAVHGYHDGISPTATSALATLWTTTRTEQKVPSGKPYWMTETSGYIDSWLGNATDKTAAIHLAMDIHAALYHGNVSAWVWWQGSAMDAIGKFTLMKGTAEKGKKYYVSKHFYRFIRPGAQMVKTTYDESIGVFATAFQHTQMGAFTMVYINNSTKAVKVNLTGANVPDTFDYYITDGGSNNCTKKDAVQKTSITLPPSSVVTLVNGQVTE
jgi:O-glycosyl hydrolase